MDTTTASPTRAADPRRHQRAERIFFSSMAGLVLITVLVGFSRTYFLAGMVAARLPSPLIHVHAVVFIAWVLLLIAQTGFVSAGRVDLHRKLGLAGFGLAVAMVVLGVLAASNSVARGFAPPGFPLGARTFFAVPMSDMLIFSILVFFAHRYRSNPAAHKRLIIIATFALMDAPTGRPPFSAITGHPYMDSVFVVFFLLLVVGYDLMSRRKIHPATAWAGLFVVLVEQARIPIGMTAPWHSFAAWVQTLAIGR